MLFAVMMIEERGELAEYWICWL